MRGLMLGGALEGFSDGLRYSIDALKAIVSSLE